MQREEGDGEAERDAMRTAHVADETEVVDRAPEQSEDEKGHATYEEGHARGHPDPEELLVFVPNRLKRQRQARVLDHGFGVGTSFLTDLPNICHATTSQAV